MSAAAQTTLHHHDTPVRVRRSRAFHRPWRIWFVSLLLATAFVAFGGFVGLAAALPVTGNRMIGIGSLACLTVFAAARLGAFALSRRLRCGLCHGTVMTDNKCRKHVDASRIRPLSFRATAALSVLFALSFGCMYCGTRYRLWK